MSAPLTATEKLQEMARERWGHASPFRIGYLAGMIGSIEGSVSPYAAGTRGDNCFQQGLRAAAEERDRAAAQSKEGQK